MVRLLTTVVLLTAAFLLLLLNINGTFESPIRATPYFNLLSSDTAYPFLLFADLLELNSNFADWHSTPALYLFPDWPLIIFVTISQAPPWSLPLLYSGLMMMLYCLAGGAILNAATGVPTTLAAWFVAAVLFVCGWMAILFDGFVSPWLLLSAGFPTFHSGALLSSLAAIALLLFVIQRKLHVVGLISLAALVLIAGVSDPLFIVWFSIPACAVALLHSLATGHGRSVGIAAAVFVASLAAYVIEAETSARAVRELYLEDRATIFESISIFKSILIRIISEGDVVFALITILLAIVFGRSAQLTARLWSQGKLTPAGYFELLIGGGCAAALLVPLLTGIFKQGVGDLDYSKFVWIALPIWIAYHIYHGASILGLQRLSWAPIAFVVGSGVALAGPALATAEVLAQPNLLQVCLRNERRSEGFGDSWTTRLTMFLSERRIHIVPIDAVGRPRRFLYKERWLTHRADNDEPLKPNFVVPARLNRERLLQHFGQPQKVLDCRGVEVWLYDNQLPLQ